MSRNLDSIGFESVTSKSWIAQFRRPIFVTGLSIIVAGLVLGTAYGGPVGPLSLYVAALFGGLIYRRARMVMGAEVYGDVLLSGMFGAVLSSLSISTAISLSLDVPIMNVIWATGLTILANLIAVASIGLAGFVVAALLTALLPRTRDAVGLALLVVGTLGFLAVQYQMGALRPDTGSLATPILSEATYNQYQLYRLGGLFAGSIGFVGFVSVLSSRQRRRIAVVAVLLVSLVVGGIGVGSVSAEINRFQTAGTLSDRIAVSVTDAELTDDNLEIAVGIENPSNRRVTLTGAYFRVSNASESRIAYGAGQRTDEGRSIVGTGETLQATYHLGLSPSQAEKLRAALDAGEVTITGQVSLHLTDTSALPTGDSGFVVRFQCTAGPDGVSC